MKAPKCSVGYECGICDHYHPADWDGDCRDKNNRYDDPDVFDELIGMDEIEDWRLAQERKARLKAIADAEGGVVLTRANRPKIQLPKGGSNAARNQAGGSQK